MSKIGKLFKGLFGGKKKAALPPPLPKIPTREGPGADPRIELARKNAALSAKVRSGRSQSILTSGSGLTDEDEDAITRPGARRAKLLGK